MSNRICGKCGSRKVVDAGSYAGSSFFKCETCGQLGMLEKFPKMTVFHQITASPEVLAEDLVYEIGDMWMSTLIVDVTFETYEEAFAATVTKLNSLADYVAENGESAKESESGR